MNSPTDLITHPDVAMTDLSVTTGEQAIRVLHARLSGATPAVKNAPKFLEALLERSLLASVGIAVDVALPHARTDAVDRLVVGVGRSPTDIVFDPAHAKVRLVFLVGIPREQVGEYLQVVAGLSRLLKTPGVREALLGAETEEE